MALGNSAGLVAAGAITIFGATVIGAGVSLIGAGDAGDAVETVGFRAGAGELSGMATTGPGAWTAAAGGRCVMISDAEAMGWIPIRTLGCSGGAVKLGAVGVSCPSA